MFLLGELGGFSGDLGFVMKFPKSPPKNRNRENLAKWPHIIVNGHFSAGLWAQKTPCTQAIPDPKREFLCIGDSGAERSRFELSSDFEESLCRRTEASLTRVFTRIK